MIEMKTIESSTVQLPFERIEADVAWDPTRHLEITPPERVTLLEEWGPAAAGPAALSPVAITSPFRFLSDEGTAALHAICSELEAYAVGDARIPKKRRGAIYRSAFLRGMVYDPTILDFLRGLAQAPLEPHPVSHHAVHINYAPDDLSLNVDQWHRDAVGFDFVLLASDPKPMKGGRFEYYAGPVEEGSALLLAGEELPPEKVLSPDFPGAGWAVLQQGHRVLHRACRLEERFPRITVVDSFWVPLPGVDDPTDLPTLLRADGREIALVEWSRYQALVGGAEARALRRDEDRLRARPERAAGGAEKRRVTALGGSRRLRHRRGGAADLVRHRFVTDGTPAALAIAGGRLIDSTQDLDAAGVVAIADAANHRL